MTLRSLLDRALVKSWDRWTWFEDVALVGDSLMVPDARRADTITRCFLPALQEHYPGLTVTVVQPDPTTAKQTAPKVRQSVFKGGKEPAPFNPDLFAAEDL